MRRKACAAGMAMVLAISFGAVQAAYPKDEPYSVDLEAGESFDVCGSGLVVCPARTPICDNPDVVIPTDLPGGLGFKGVAPGSTLCSAASAVGPRRVFRITVH